MKPVRILIADDHEMVRRGLCAVLNEQSGWQVCAEVGDGRAAVEKARELKPDVAVLDMSMPNLNGLDAARQIQRISPRTRIVMLTMHDSEDLVREVLDLGVLGYLLKSDAGRDLVSAVQAVLQRRPFFTATVSQAVLQGYLHPAKSSRRERGAAGRLTPREREIVQLLAEGKSNKEVADRLNITVKTAETHRANIMRKLGLASFSDLVRYAIRHHLIEA